MAAQQHRPTFCGSKSAVKILRPLNPPHETCFHCLAPGGPVQGTFPNPQHAPAGFSQRAVHQFITLLVAGKLPPPEHAIVFRLRRVLRAAVPETAVHEQREPRWPENEIHPHGQNAECGVRSAE